MNCNFLIILALTFLVLGASPARATITKNLGTVGETYPVIEPDVVAELKQKAEEKDKSKDNSLVERMKKYQPADLHPLPRAEGDRTFLVDMTYSLERDLVDGEGKVIYPGGYTFNPLDYISFSGGLVVIDADDPSQVNWFRASPYLENHQARLLLSNGHAFDLIEQLKRPVFYLTDDIAGRLQLSAVPSVVIQRGNRILVRECYIPDKVRGRSDENK